MMNNKTRLNILRTGSINIDRYILTDPFALAISIVNLSLGVMYLVYMLFGRDLLKVTWVDICLVIVFYSYFMFTFYKSFSKVKVDLS